MNVDAQIAGPIVFEDGTPIIDKLQVLDATVAKIIGDFQSLFD